MKKRRIALLAFLLAATLVIGVGYAAINKNLVAQTKFATRANAENFPIVISDITAEKFALNDDGTYDGVTGVAVTFTEEVYTSGGSTVDIKLPDGSITREGDKVVITVTIQNDSEHFGATLGTPSVSNTASDYISCVVGNYGSSTLTVNNPEGDTDDTTVTITLTLDTPPLDSLTDITVSVTFPANATLPTT